MNIGSLLPRHARTRGDHTAIVFDDQRLSFRQFNARVNRLCNALNGLGVKKGDKVLKRSLRRPNLPKPSQPLLRNSLT